MRITISDIVNTLETAIHRGEPIEKCFNQEEIEFIVSQAEKTEKLSKEVDLLKKELNK